MFSIQIYHPYSAQNNREGKVTVQHIRRRFNFGGVSPNLSVSS